VSLKTEIESTLSDAIEVIAGAGSLDVDTNLNTEDRLLNTKFGALPMDSEFAEGPFTRVVVENNVVETEEFGNPSGRVSTILFAITVAGMTRLCNHPTEAGVVAGDTEEIIRLHLQDLAFDIETSYGAGRVSYASELQYRGASYEVGTISGRQTAPVVEAPVPSLGNSGHGVLRINPDQAFSGRQSETITVQVVTPNLTAGVSTGLTIRYKIDSGAWSNPIPVGNGFVPLAHNIFIAIAVTGIVSVGDAWTIQAKTSQLYSVGMWVQAWVMRAEATAVY
jgi:hypothetical protein